MSSMEETEGDDRGPSRCLIVDDSADVRFLLRLGLEKAGFEVVAETATVSGALVAAASFDPDLVLLDLTLDDGDSLTLIGMVRRLLPQVHIAVCSGSSYQSNGERCLEAGADSYLEKISLLGVGNVLAELLLLRRD